MYRDKEFRRHHRKRIIEKRFQRARDIFTNSHRRDIWLNRTWQDFVQERKDLLEQFPIGSRPSAFRPASFSDNHDHYMSCRCGKNRGCKAWKEFHKKHRDELLDLMAEYEIKDNKD